MLCTQLRLLLARLGGFSILNTICSTIVAFRGAEDTERKHLFCPCLLPSRYRPTSILCTSLQTPVCLQESTWHSQEASTLQEKVGQLEPNHPTGHPDPQWDLDKWPRGSGRRSGAVGNKAARNVQALLMQRGQNARLSGLLGASGFTC